MPSLKKDPTKKLSPSEFMRDLRPENYSDSSGTTSYLLDAPTLEYHLDSITSRNQTHAFEIFCRKLCERTICPNLKPATGPEGGGDSKADTETIPISDELTSLTYIGLANSGNERWAFAFSAKKRWKEKVRSDVEGVVQTQRGYSKIFCVTSQFARSKDRAQLEDELSQKYDLVVTILDRSWIVEQVIGADRRDLAFNYLSVGQEARSARRLGVSDYSRLQQLEDIERALTDPAAFSGMEVQRVTEALVAAKLSRNAELPRIETDGRFSRAVRLAQQDGTFRQRIDAQYEQIWTAFWWFDDISYTNDSYDEFERLVSTTDNALHLELLCNVLQLLFNSVQQEYLTRSQCKLDTRAASLLKNLESLAADQTRPNNALAARVSALMIQVNWAMVERSPEKLTLLWTQFYDVLLLAKGLGEFSFDRFTKLIDVFGMVAANDAEYAKLIDELAAAVSERAGEAQGGLILLKRAKQLDFEDNLEMIRLLGKAARQLTKKEHADELTEALHLLALAYRSAGLPWAARASCMFAIATVVVESEESSELPPSIVPLALLLAAIAIEIGHIPDTLESICLARGCVEKLPLTDESKERATKFLQELDLIVACQILNLTETELQKIKSLPDTLERLEMIQSRTALLYTLGHEDVLRNDGSIPESESSDAVSEIFIRLANQPAASKQNEVIVTNQDKAQCFTSRVYGVELRVHHSCTEASILAAEAVIGAIEATFATMFDFKIMPYTESFSITIHEKDGGEPDFEVDADRMSSNVYWPAGLIPATFNRQGEVRPMLVSLATTVLAVTCMVRNFEETVEKLFHKEAVLDRIAMVMVAGNSRHRTFSKAVSSISDWVQANTVYQLRATRPVIEKRPSKPIQPNNTPEVKTGYPFERNDHRAFAVRSVIDAHLWDRARWFGTAFAEFGPDVPPVIALMFKDEAAARSIFKRWKERFGNDDRDDEIYLAIVREISSKNPSHYRVLVTSSPSSLSNNSDQVFSFVTRTQTMYAESGTYLNHFLAMYARTRAYLIAPAVMGPEKSPDFLMDLAILKRRLSVKKSSEI